MSLKPECLRVIVGAPKEEVAAAKEVAGPALREALEETQKQFQKPEPTADATSTTQIPERERSRSWSPDLETRNAAGAAALQAASMASARGLNAAQAEAFGQAAAEKSLQYARLVAMAKKKAATAQNQFSQAAAADAARSNMPSVSSTAIPKVQKRAPPKSVAVAQTGDTLEAFGLKGEADEGLNGDRGVIKHIFGFGPRTRFVMTFTQFIIDDNGDLGEKEREVTLTADNLRLPGTGTVNEEGTREDEEKQKEGKKKSRSKSNDKVKKKARSKSRGRRKKSKSGSRSRRRSRRSRSRRK